MSNTEQAPAYVCIVKTSQAIGLMMTVENRVATIHGFHTPMEGLRYFEDGYNSNHGRSYEASMSACINGITFRPSILKLSLDEIRALAPAMSVVKVRNSSGGMVILPLDAEKAEALWETGSKPKLIGETSAREIQTAP